MSADLIIEELVGRLTRRFGGGRQDSRARILTFGAAITCSINYSKVLHGNKYFFGLPAAMVDPARSFAKTEFGDFALLICGSADNVLVIPRALLLDMTRGVGSRRLDVFVEGSAYIPQTTKHPKRDVTEYRNRFPEAAAPGQERPEGQNRNDMPDRLHVKVQFALICLGQAEGCRVWVPIGDRNLSYRGQPFSGLTIGSLPNLGFDENTRRIVQNIDVLWLHRNVILKAFEIESTTSVYSGLLRLSDLVLAQPNIQIALYVAAAKARRDRVYSQLLRPSFRALLPKCEFVTFEHIFEKLDQLQALSVESGARVSGLIRGEKFSVPDHFLYPDHA